MGVGTVTAVVAATGRAVASTATAITCVGIVGGADILIGIFIAMCCLLSSSITVTGIGIPTDTGIVRGALNFA